MKIELNQWETDFFGRKIGRLQFEQSARENDLCSTLDWQPFSLIQVKVATNAVEQIEWLKKHNFQPVVEEITFRLDLAKYSDDLTACDCRVATFEDLPCLKALMGSAFPDTRFQSPYFSPQENQKFYQQWIENAVFGQFDDLCLIAEHQGNLQGAVSVCCQFQQAKLGLIAVAENYQGRGIAKNLLKNAIAWAISQRAKQLEIITQLSNFRAIRLYQSFGAEVLGTHYWFYK